MNTLLVTGGAGFIGANFVHHWTTSHPDDVVIVLDALTYAANPASLLKLKQDKKITFIQGDICDSPLLDSVFKDHAIDKVVHFAAESHVDRSIAGPDPFIQTNVVGTHCLLKAALSAWDGSSGGRRFHHVSTDEVYGSLSAEEAPFTELTAYAPNSTYSASKAASDHLVRAYNKTHGLPVTTSNCSNNYGPLHFPEKLIPLAITNLLHGKNVPVYGDGLNIRDWLYVEDHCLGIERVLLNGRDGETYNIGGNCELTNIDLIKTLCNLVDERLQSDAKWAAEYPQAAVFNGAVSSSLITYVTDRPGHDRRYAIDASKARDELGYSPTHDFDSGLRKTVQWYLDNAQWWGQILNGSYLER